MSEVVIILIFYLVTKIVLDLMQIYTIKTASIDPVSVKLLDINNDNDAKSRAYNISKLNLSVIRSLLYVGWIYFLLFGGLIKQINLTLETLNFSYYLINLYTILISYILIHITMVVLSFYSTFMIEAKYEFNTSSKLLFIKDNIISLIMTLVLITLISTVFFYLVPYKDFWWILMASIIFFMIIVSIYIYPTYISPIFNKFKNLEDEEIENEIKDLSDKTNFSIENLYVMDKSKRSKHPNAYFTGFRKNRRIVFYDTLIELLSPREVKAVLAHEIGHYKLNHIKQSLILSTCVIFIGMFFLSQLVNNNNYLEMLNLSFNVSSQLLALIFTYQIVSFFIDPIFSILSRKNEYEADKFASEQVDKVYLISSLIKLYKENLTFLKPNKLYAMVYFSHPTVLERINMLRCNNEKS